MLHRIQAVLDEAMAANAYFSAINQAAAILMQVQPPGDLGCVKTWAGLSAPYMPRPASTV